MTSTDSLTRLLIAHCGRAAPAMQTAPTFDDAAGWRPLGYTGDRSIIWSHARQCVLEATPRDLGSRTWLTLALGADEIAARWGVTTVDRAGRPTVTIPWDRVSADVAAACAGAGVYTPDRLRGSGVWAAGGDTLIVSSGRCLRAAAGALTEQARAIPGQRTIYPAGRDLGDPAAVEAAADEQVQEIYDALDGWHWQRPGDAALLLGWIAAAGICGALPRRPHLWIEARRGAGKSTLLGLVAGMLGRRSIYVTDARHTSEAGIRQSLAIDARAVVLDEAEDRAQAQSAGHVAQILGLMRAAYSAAGSGVIKGSPAGDARSFSITTTILAASIAPPKMEAADRTRCPILSILPPTSGHSVPDLATDEERQAELGLRLWRRTIDRWPSIRVAIAEAARLIRERGGDARAGDTLGVLVGAAAGLTGTAVGAVIDQIDLDHHLLAHGAEAADEADALHHLLHRVVRWTVTANGRDGDRSITREAPICNLVRQAADETRDARLCARPSGDALGRYGIAVRPIDGRIEIGIATRAHPELDRLFAGTVWAGGGYVTQLLRAAGAVQGRVRLPSGRPAGVWVPVLPDDSREEENDREYDR